VCDLPTPPRLNKLAPLSIASVEEYVPSICHIYSLYIRPYNCLSHGAILPLLSGL